MNTLSYAQVINDICNIREEEKPDYMKPEEEEISGLIMVFNRETYVVFTEDDFNTFQIYKNGSKTREKELEFKLEEEIEAELRERKQDSEDWQRTMESLSNPNYFVNTSQLSFLSPMSIY